MKKYVEQLIDGRIIQYDTIQFEKKLPLVDVPKDYKDNENKYIFDGLKFNDISQTPDYITDQLTSAKTVKLTEVNTKAYDYEDNGSISYTGINADGNSVTVQIETSDKNIGKINGLINMFNAEKITQYIWSAKDDTQFIIKKDDAYNLSGLFAEFSSKIWIEKQPYFKNLVEKATTIDELNTIGVDYSLDVPTVSL